MASVRFKGNEVKIKGGVPNEGTVAPSFTLVSKELKELSLESFEGKNKLLNIFPSLDTEVCGLSVKTFYERCSDISDLVVLNISKDLPFAAARFCQTFGIGDTITLSAFRSSFSDDYGVTIVDGALRGLCTRAAILLSPTNEVLYVELVPEITKEPDYDAILDLF